MIIDSGLNRLKIGLSDCSFSDGNGQHDQRIPERDRRRQQKMHGSEKKSFGWNFGWKSRQRWVEMKNRGLKTGGISASLTY